MNEDRTCDAGGTNLTQPRSLDVHPKRSNIHFCHFILTHADRESGKIILDFPDKPLAGAGYVNLEGYLICPLEMFTERQLKMASKKYEAAK